MSTVSDGKKNVIRSRRKPAITVINARTSRAVFEASIEKLLYYTAYTHEKLKSFMTLLIRCRHRQQL